MPTATLPPVPSSRPAQPSSIRGVRGTALPSVPPRPTPVRRYAAGGGNAYEQLARKVAKEQFGNDPLADVFYRMMKQESDNFDPDVVTGKRSSSAGAQGVAQFMPATAKQLGINPLDPAQALPAAAKYLKTLVSNFGGDVTKGVAAYNYGGGNVQNAVTKGGQNWQSQLPAQTQTYLRVTQPQAAGKNPDLVQLPEPITGKGQSSNDVIKLPQPIDGSPPQVDKMPLVTKGGGYVFPVQGFNGKVEQHHGSDKGAADLFAKPGTPVLAMRGGKVVSVGNADNGGPGGNNVTIQGDDGNMYYYAHMVAPAGLKAGQQVQAGQTIGGVGETGNAKGTGAHLHIGIGPSIASGVGPHGGAGENFDATSLLTNTLSGKAGTGTPTAPARTTRADSDPALKAGLDSAFKTWQTLTGQRDQLLADLQSGKISKEPVKRDSGPAISDYDVATQITLPTLTRNVGEAFNEYKGMKALDKQDPDTRAALQQAETSAGRLRLDTRAQDYTEYQGGVKNQLDLANLGVAQGNLQNSWTDTLVRGTAAAANILEAGFNNSKGVADTMLTAIKTKNDALTGELDNAVKVGSLTVSQATAIAQAVGLQQSAEATRTIEVTARAKLISDIDWRNATRLLPKGSHYVANFRPDSGMNQELARLGISPTVIEANQVDVSKLTPEAAFGTAEGLTKQVPGEAAYGIPAMRQNYADIKNIKQPTLDKPDPNAIADSLAAANPNLQPYADAISNALNGGAPSMTPNIGIQPYVPDDSGAETPPDGPPADAGSTPPASPLGPDQAVAHGVTMPDGPGLVPSAGTERNFSGGTPPPLPHPAEQAQQGSTQDRRQEERDRQQAIAAGGPAPVTASPASSGADRIAGLPAAAGAAVRGGYQRLRNGVLVPLTSR